MTSRQRQLITRQRHSLRNNNYYNRYNNNIVEHICCRSCRTRFIECDTRSIFCIYENNGQVNIYRMRAERSVNITRGNANLLHCGSCNEIIGYVNNRNGLNFRYYVQSSTIVKSITIFIN